MELPETRASLMLRLSDPQNERAWGEFLETYEPFLLRLGRGQGLQECDARDVTQQVLANVARSIADWQPDGEPASFRRWLFRVARNEVLKFLAKRDRQPPGLGGSDFLERVQNLPQPDRPEMALCDREYRETVFLWAAEQVREEFREASWKAFWESAVKHRPVADVASELKMTVGAVYVARSRIIARLRIKVQQFDADEESNG